MRILLCDAHRLLVEALAPALSHAGHDIVSITTRPEDALAAAMVHDPDVCLMDIVFPGGDGIQGVAAIRAKTRSKVLVLSARSDPESVCAAITAGATGFVGKTQGVEDIVRSLDDVCAGHMSSAAEVIAAASKRLERPNRAESVALRYLTCREREALRLIAEGESTKEIARSMHVAHSTARTHVQNVLTKLGVSSRLQAAALVARIGIIEQLEPGTAVDRSSGSDARSGKHRTRPPANG